MEWEVDAIFDHGMLRPLEPLPLRESERVRVTVESSGQDRGQGHLALIEHLRASLGYDLGGVYPSREELHERGGRAA